MALFGFKSMPMRADRAVRQFYAATKAEVVILTRRFALELGQHGITVRVRLHELVDQQVLDR